MKDKSYSNIALSMVSKVIAVIAYFGVDILCARILPMKDYASWIYYTSIKTMLAYVAYFGLNTSTKVLVAQSANEEERLKCLRASIKIRTIINLVFAALLTIFSQFLAAKLDEYNRYSGFSDMFWAMGLLVLLESFFEFYKQISYGLNDYKMLVQVTGIEFGSNFILSFFFLEIQRDIFGVFWASVLSGIVTLFTCDYLLNKNYKYRTQPLDIMEETLIWKQLLKYAFPLLACDIANLIALELDTSMIGLLSNKEQVAFYNIGKKLVSKAGHVNLAIAGGVMTSFAVITDGNFNNQKQKFKKYFGLNTIAAICVCAVLLAFACGGVVLIYGNEYSGAIKIIFLLIPYYIMFAISSFLALFLDFQRKTTLRSIVSVISTFLNLILNLILIPYYGAIGAVAATLVAELIYFTFICLSSIKIWRQYKSKYN